MIDAIKRMFSKPSAAMLAQRELEEAERQLLRAQSQAEYYTSMGKRPVLSIVRKSGTGHGTNVIGGLAMGMESTVLPILLLAAGIWGSFALAGMYGVAIAAAGMMATTAMQLAIDAFGNTEGVLDGFVHECNNDGAPGL